MPCPHSRFLRGLLNCPPLNRKRSRRIISFEAQQNVPFPIDDVVWDYQLVGGGLEEQIQVVLVAIKIDLLDDINGGVKKLGLHTSTIDVAPMATLQCVSLQLPECERVLDARGYRGADDQCSLH